MENLYQQQRIIMKRIIAIVAGGDSSEHGVSMKSAEGIYSFIDQQKYNLYIVELTHKSWEAILPDGTRAAIDKNDFSFEETGKESSRTSLISPFMELRERTESCKVTLN